MKRKRIEIILYAILLIISIFNINYFWQTLNIVPKVMYFLIGLILVVDIIMGIGLSLELSES